MWRIIFLAAVITLGAGYAWVSFAFGRFKTIKRLLPSWWKRLVAGAVVTALLLYAVYLALDFVNMAIIFLHLAIIWIFCDLISLAARRLGLEYGKHYIAGICAISFTVLWLAIGWYNAHHVICTDYRLKTQKIHVDGGLSIIGLSDSHVGATFHYQEFKEYIAEISKRKPDIVVIMGDFVDDDTSREDMEQCCKILGNLRTRYGTFFVYGNHDEGYWQNRSRGYSIQDIDRNLAENGVRILRDETVNITENIYISGRLDKSRYPGRKSASELMQGRGSNDYVIMLDHEPNDYGNEANSKADLVISGHTHGGQFLGLGALGVMLGANDSYYGHEKLQGTDFIVSSGIGDWAIKFKTGCISEYISIKIQNE